jgi:hypothetical protein
MKTTQKLHKNIRLKPQVYLRLWRLDKKMKEITKLELMSEKIFVIM